MYKLLIAEDEYYERSALRIIINKHFPNINILEDASNGLQAINLCSMYNPDIILIDIKMPKITGLDALESILKTNPKIKAIILTAYPEFEYVQKALKLGACDYILKPAKPIEIQNALNKLVSSLNIHNTKVSQNNISYKNSIQKALEYINNNYSKALTLESVASEVFLNPQYFSRYFKKHTGLNFIEYLSKIRVTKAKTLLSTTNNSINNIGLSVGYIDQSYFTKVFLKYEGVTPLKYRLMLNENTTLN